MKSSPWGLTYWLTPTSLICPSNSFIFIYFLLRFSVLNRKYKQPVQSIHPPHPAKHKHLQMLPEKQYTKHKDPTRYARYTLIYHTLIYIKYLFIPWYSKISVVSNRNVFVECQNIIETEAIFEFPILTTSQVLNWKQFVFWF